MFTMARFVFLGVALLCSLSAVAQTLSGVVTDQKTREGLISATVQLIAGDGKTSYTSTDLKGMFQFKKLQAGAYTLQISYVGYKTYKETVTVPASGEKKVSVTMREDVNLLGEVSVNARATRAEQKGDSLLYNAEAFKVMQGSSAEDLLAKMPGIVVEGGSIQAQGEEVKKVLVDGKEFFDGDVNLAIKNLPSDIIAGIEVFDKKSVELAGGFGNYLSPENVVRIGMLPRACLSKIRPLGNAALAGASMLALDGENWRKLAEIPEKCRYLELSGRDDFSRAFTDSLTF